MPLVLIHTGIVKYLWQILILYSIQFAYPTYSGSPFSDEIAIMIRHYVIHPYLKIRHYVIHPTKCNLPTLARFYKSWMIYKKNLKTHVSWVTWFWNFYHKGRYGSLYAFLFTLTWIHMHVVLHCNAGGNISMQVGMLEVHIFFWFIVSGLSLCTSLLDCLRCNHLCVRWGCYLTAPWEFIWL